MLLAGCDSTSSVVRATVCVSVCALVSHCGSKLSIRVPISCTHNTHYCISIALIEKRKEKKMLDFFSTFFCIHYAEFDWIGTQLGHSFADQSVWVTNLQWVRGEYLFYRVNTEQPEDYNVAVSINVLNTKYIQIFCFLI